MLLQNQIKHKEIKKNGCHLLCLLKLEEYENGITHTEKSIIETYEYLLLREFIWKDCYILRPQEICDCLHLPFQYIGWRPIGYEAQFGDIIIGRKYGTRNKRHFQHFVIMNEGTVVYDPYPSSFASKYAPVKDLRVYKKRFV